MGRYAQTIEEAFLRRKELIDTERKQGYAETFFLYQFILLHSWATGKCDKTLPKLCEIYRLEYHNSTRRLKILREKGWIENTDKHIRPLLIHRSGKDDGVKNTPEKPVKQSVNSTPDFGVKITPLSVKITPNECNNYTKNGANGVNITPKKAETPFEISDSSDANLSLNFKPDLETTSSSKKTLSKFTEKECLLYIEKRIENGEKIETPHKLAHWCYQTGEMDVFIRAMLYPEPVEPIAEVVEQQIEYSDEFYESLEPEPLTVEQRQSSLIMCRGMLRDTTIENLENNMSVMFTPEDWAWLKGELRNAR